MKPEEHVRYWLDSCPAAAWAEGITWYDEAAEFIHRLSTETGVPDVAIAGVVAALSPSVYWGLNKRQAEAMVRQYADSGMEHIDLVPTSTYGGQVKKAHRILALDCPATNDVERILGRRAFKTRAFFRNLLRLASPDVCVDTHIVRALGWEDRFTQSARWCYDRLAAAIATVAVERGMKPCTVQAIVWCSYKHQTEAYNAQERYDRKHDIAPF